MNNSNRDKFAHAIRTIWLMDVSRQDKLVITSIMVSQMRDTELRGRYTTSAWARPYQALDKRGIAINPVYEKVHFWD